MSNNITAEMFEEVMGYAPEHDDLERCNCDKAGQVGHIMCGWCTICNKPRFICGHYMVSNVSHNVTNDNKPIREKNQYEDFIMSKFMNKK